MTDRPVQPSIPPRVGPIARYGPVSLVLAAIVATLAFVQFSDRAPAGEGASRLAATVAKPEAGERLVLPDGVMSWPVAARDGIRSRGEIAATPLPGC